MGIFPVARLAASKAQFIFDTALLRSVSEIRSRSIGSPVTTGATDGEGNRSLGRRAVVLLLEACQVRVVDKVFGEDIHLPTPAGVVMAVVEAVVLSTLIVSA
jgi:hypothetical protein